MKHDCHYFVSDLETGGFKASENPITEVAITVLNQDLIEVEKYNSYIIPYDNLKITEGALQHSNITLDLLFKQGKDIKVVFSEILTLAEKYKCGRYNLPMWVGHNFSEFDINFIFYLFRKFNKNYSDYFLNHVEDTLVNARKKYGNIEIIGYKLAEICEIEGISLFDAHGASNDTEATVKLFVNQTLNLRSGKSVATQQEYKRDYTFPI